MRKITVLFVFFCLCVYLGGCGGQREVSKVQLPLLAASEAAAQKSAAQKAPARQDSAASRTKNVPAETDTPEGKTTLVLGGIGLRDDTLASLVNNFNAENTKYTVVLDDYGFL